MSEQEQSIDLRVLLKVLTEHLIPIAVVTVVAAVIGFSLASFVVPKQYVSSALMYVENSTSKSEDSAINSTDITAAQKLVSTCQILFTSDRIMKELSDSLGNKYSAGALKSAVSIGSVNNTEVLRIQAETKDPNDSYDIVNNLLRLSTDEFKRIIKGGSIETVSEPAVPRSHSYPSVPRFTMIGALIGFALAYVLFLIMELLDIKVKPDDDLAQIYDIPVFAEILDFETAGKHGYKYYKYKKYGSYESYEQDENSKEGKLYNDEEESESEDEKVSDE